MPFTIQHDETISTGSSSKLILISERSKEKTFSSVKSLVDQILINGLQKGASDIHFEPYKTEYRIRLRIDGVLKVAIQLDPVLTGPIAVRLKVMAQLDIAEKRVAQDGQLIFCHNDANYTMRMSTLPVEHGEKIVLRMIKTNSMSANIEQLGLCSHDLKQYRCALALPQGLILVCGPTGSGKTLTLYSGLNYIGQAQKNICSIEDPIEITLPGINQTQINVRKNLTFSRILRAILRQDPDVIMIGEIRDIETAKTAIQAAHTGHLVLTTLHTNSSCEAFIRLNQMGIPTHLIASALKLVISQRLLRVSCPFCKCTSMDPTIECIKNPSVAAQAPVSQNCSQCIDGYRGRTGVYEFLTITPKVQEYLFSGKKLSLHDLEKIACQDGMKTLYNAANDLIKKGITSYAEVNRIMTTLRENES